jgi:hypothetical protein
MIDAVLFPVSTSLYIYERVLNGLFWMDTGINQCQCASEQAVKSPAMSSKYAIALAITGIIKDKNLQGNYLPVTDQILTDPEFR